jgi:ParB family chromosome partitioning protein
LPRPDFRTQAAERLAAERTELTPAIIDLLKPEPTGRITDVHHIRVDHISPNPDQPRLTFDEESLIELASSIKEHGVLQPVLVRPFGEGGYQLIAGERRWRATKIAGLEDIPAIVEDIDDEAALEIAIIENLQREDLSPLDEAVIYERMTSKHGYSLRRLAQKLGKDKGYVENRLRLYDAPPEIQELVAIRQDTLSHAYELLKVEDARKRKRLAKQVAAGELSLVKLRQRIEAKPKPPPEAEPIEEIVEEEAEPELVAVPIEGGGLTLGDIDLEGASEHLAAAVEELAMALIRDPSLSEASTGERQRYAKFLTIAKIKLENAIAVVRAGEAREPSDEIPEPVAGGERAE